MSRRSANEPDDPSRSSNPPASFTSSAPSAKPFASSPEAMPSRVKQVSGRSVMPIV
jgi:hypothetical protein